MLFSFERKIKSYIESQNLIYPLKKVIVAVSGGPDSMCLLHILFSLKYEVTVCHINYNLRGEDSDLDEKLVVDYCTMNQIDFFIKRFDTKRICLEMNRGVQEVTRQLRYDWIKELCVDLNIQRVATGHHMDDQAETFLFNLIRGTGLKGAAGIHPIRALETTDQHIKIVRPLLCARKSEIQEYLTAKNILFRQDISNAKDDYTRNKIRHHILPILNTIHPQSTEHIADHTAHMYAVLPYYNQWVLDLKREFISIQPDFIKIKLEKTMHPSILYILLEEYGFNSSQVRQIKMTLTEGQTGKIFYSDDYTLILASDSADIVRSTDKKIVEEKIEKLPYEFNHFGYHLVIDRSEVNDLKGDQITSINFDYLKWPLVIRSWQPGDRMSPLGMNGKQKKIQDILTDKKISGVIKKNALVLISSGEIIWLWPCNVISEHCKIVDPLQLALKIIADPI